jgi:hypothetical protein
MPRSLVPALALVAASLAVAAPARAQQGSRGATDYLVGQPKVRFALSIGWDAATARSDFWDVAFDRFTFGRGSLAAPRVGAELGIPVGSRLEFVFGAGIAQRGASTEYRDLVDNADRPIEQETRLRRLPLSAGVRFNLVPAGRGVGTIAWIPRRVVPWVGAGGGVTRWTVRQRGDFVDFTDSTVFSNTFRSRGWAPSAYGAAGVDIGLGPRTSLAIEGRYTRARDRLGEDFIGFDPLDLSGVAVTAGFSWRF